MEKRIVFDIEGSGLPDTITIDYSSMPYRLKKTFKLHCLVAIDRATKEITVFDDHEINIGWIFDGRPYRLTIGEVEQELVDYEPVVYKRAKTKDIPKYFKDVSSLAGHNIIDYDLLMLELYFGPSMAYTVEPDTLGGKAVQIIDTLVLSKTLNPDRYGGHSLEELSRGAKFDYKLGFDVYNPIMLYYCIKDVLANYTVLADLGKEYKSWESKKAGKIDFSNPLKLEKELRYNVTRQSHFGFKFNKELAQWCVKDLDEKSAAIEANVEPQLPLRPLKKTEMGEFIPPKNQYKQDGTLSSHMERFMEKHKGKVLKKRVEITGKKVKKELLIVEQVELYGKKYSIPLPTGEAIVKEAPMRMSDQEEIKQYIMREFDWEPSVWNETALNMDSKKKPLPEDQYIERVERYVEDTLGSVYEKARCAHLDCTPGTLKNILLKAGEKKKTIKVLTQPKFVKNQDKDLCDDLVRIGQRVNWVGDVNKWLTYRNRRNSICSENGTGWLNDPRLDVDGRINTPADTCGASTTRFMHRGVVNVPRVTTLYGEYMRALFEPGIGVQIGSDAASLEARIEAHYCIAIARKALAIAEQRGGLRVAVFENRVKKALEYGESLLASKPNSVHCKMAARLGIIRDLAKNIKYGLTYGASANKLRKMLGVTQERAEEINDGFWEEASPLKDFKDALERYWETVGDKKFIVSIDGRALPTRSKHSLVNTAFQSAGVLCMKWASCWWQREMQLRGWAADPFRDNPEEKLFAMKMIDYHDEGQLAVHRKHITDYKLFTDKEAAAAWKEKRESETGNLYSAISKKNGKYFVGYAEPGELFVIGIRKAGEHFKLEIALDGEYIIGDNWGTCH